MISQNGGPALAKARLSHPTARHALLPDKESKVTIPGMHRQLAISPTRVLAGLAIAVVISVACAVAIHLGGGNVQPVVELGLCLGTATALSMTVPHLLGAWKTTMLGSLLRRPIRAHLATIRAVLFEPRRLQFSVQAGLIYLTVVCIWLGFCVNRVHRLRDAAQAIEQAGGRVVYDSTEPFIKVRTVAIARRGAPWDDATIRRLLPHIRSLKPRRIVVGSMASEAIVAEIESAFPTAEIRSNRGRESGA